MPIAGGAQNGIAGGALSSKTSPVTPGYPVNPGSMLICPRKKPSRNPKIHNSYRLNSNSLSPEHPLSTARKEMAVSVDSKSQTSEVHTAVCGGGAGITDAELRTAVNSTLRNRTTSGKTVTTRTALSTATAIPGGISYDKMVSAFATVTFSYLLLAITTYVEMTVGAFHLAYFSYRNPAVAKDLIKTAYHLLKTSYDAKLLTATEIVEVTNNSIIKPMARQNKQHYLEESQRTAQLGTMRTSKSQ